MNKICAFVAAGMLAAGTALADGNPAPGTPVGSTNSICPILTAEQLREMIKTTKDLVVVDVLPKQYYDECHITGSINIPENQIPERVGDWPKDRKIVLYCKDKECDSSRAAARVLVSLGFTGVMNYEGGILEWQAKKFEVEVPAKAK